MPYYAKSRYASKSRGGYRSSTYRKPYTSSYGTSSGYRSRYSSRGKYPRYKSSNIESVAAAVARRLKKMPQKPSQGVSRQVTVRSEETDVNLFIGQKETVFCVPVTWCIPNQRPAGAGPDDRYRQGNVVHFTGVQVRFTIKFRGMVRVRVVVYKPNDSTCVERFQSRDTGDVKESFSLRFQDPNGSVCKPRGPFALVPVRRSGVGIKDEMTGEAPELDGVENFELDAPDRSVYTAKLAPLGSVSRPVADFKHEYRAMNNFVEQKDVKVWCRIDKQVRFNTESSTESIDTGYQALVYVESIGVTPPGSKPVSDMSLLCVSSCVYYR